MQLIVIDSQNKIIFSKHTENETVKDIKKQISLNLRMKSSRFMLLHENIPLQNKQQILKLPNQGNIILTMRLKRTVLNRALKFVLKLVQSSSIPSVVKALTLMLLFITDNKILAGIISVIYVLITLSTHIKFRIDTSLGNHLKIAGKVFMCFFASMFMIYGEENFV